MRLLLASLVLVLASGCSTEAEDSVLMTEDRRYDPATLSIQVGEDVMWINESREAHSVTAYQSSISSGATYFSSNGASSEKEARAHVGDLMSNGDAVSIKFNEPGTYEYFCIPHEDQGMRGKIVVEG